MDGTRRSEAQKRTGAAVFGYARVSTSAQEKHGYSLIEQQHRIREYCESKGWVLHRTFSDTISGAAADEEDLTLPRPEFEALLATVNGLHARYVVVVHTSRLWRSDLARILVTRALKKAKLDVHSIEQPSFSLYSSEPSAVFTDGVMTLIDQYERLSIAARTRRGRITKAQQGGYAGGQAPYGYQAVRGSKVLTVNEDEARIVKRIFALHRRGLSDRAIAKRLCGEGIPTRTGKQWTNVQILLILRRRRFYEGKTYRYAGVEAKSQQPEIL